MFKKTQKTLAILVLIFMLMATICFATDENTPAVTNENPDAAETSEGEQNQEGTTNADDLDFYEDDLYLFQDVISTEQTIDGNAFLMGKDITVSSKIGGDLFIFGDNVTLTEDSYIYGNLFVFANKVSLNGIVCDLYAASDSFVIGETGIVLRDMRTFGNTLELNGSIGRSTHIEANNVMLGEKAHIYGDFNYSSKEAIQVPSGAVDGNINYTELAVTDKANDTVLSYVMDCAYSIVYTLAVFGIMLLLAPNFLKKLPEVVAKHSLVSFGIGLLVLAATVPVAILLILTIVGTPVAFALLAVWAFLVFGLAFAITTIAIASLVGNKVALLGKAHNLLAVILVTIVLWALTQIPFFVGTIVQMLIYIFGLGYLFVTAFKNRKKEEV